MSKWTNIECDSYTYDEEEQKYSVKAQETSDGNQTVIAKIDMGNKAVEYIDEDAKTDEYAQAVIREMLENGYVLTE